MAVRAGKLRPSQVVTQFGPGCLVDLPEMSMVLAGIDDWNTGTSWRIGEPRLQRALKVKYLLKPPYLSREGAGGLPARVFPTYLSCPRCNRLAHHGAFEFTPRGKKYLCKATGCKGKGKAPAFPVRFMVACENGHLDDFPWHRWVHPDIPDCSSELRLEDSGATGSITDLWVRCPEHGSKMSLGPAFGANGRKRVGGCSARRPWLDDIDPKGCTKEPRVLLRGASNAYFSVTSSALSIPPWSDPIQAAVGTYETELAKVDTRDKLDAFFDIVNAPELAVYHRDDVWEALQKLRGLVELDPAELRRDEYEAFIGSKGPIDYRSEFKVKPEEVSELAAGVFDRVIKALRLREVRAMRGFTRIDPIPDIGEMGEVDAIKAGLAPISAERLDWLPGVELRGEGVFVTLDAERLAAWEKHESIAAYGGGVLAAQEEWLQRRGALTLEPRTPRYVLVHSLAHLLIRRFELEAGYAGASLRERIYSGPNMAGFLIYTATPDSEGTLGGLVELARTEDFGAMLDRALDEALLCANDPLCASRELEGSESHLNGAACHACLLLPETSCETGNHYLDRTLIVPTLRSAGKEPLAFVQR